MRNEVHYRLIDFAAYCNISLNHCPLWCTQGSHTHTRPPETTSLSSCSFL